MTPRLLLIAALALPAEAGQPVTPAAEDVCDPAAVERMAGLLVELRHASVERQRAIGPEIAELLQAAVDRTPAGDPRGYEQAVTPCFVRALERARQLLGGKDAAPAGDPTGALAASHRASTLARLRQVTVALHMYMAENDRLPTAEQGLKLLVDQGILRRENLLDGWGRVLIYRPARGDPFEFELSSAGADGVAHTEDDVTLPFP